MQSHIILKSLSAALLAAKTINDQEAASELEQELPVVMRELIGDILQFMPVLSKLSEETTYYSELEQRLTVLLQSMKTTHINWTVVRLELTLVKNSIITWKRTATNEVATNLSYIKNALAALETSVALLAPNDTENKEIQGLGSYRFY